MYYTGIGSRGIPPDIVRKFEVFGQAFAQLGLTLRSGAAAGADAAFERGCDKVGGEKEIYLPWKGFRDHPSELHYLSPDAREQAEQIYGPRWEHVSETTRKFMTRNMYQVSGLNLDTPSLFIVCWTPDGCNTAGTRKKETGGTGQAISYGSYIDVPIFNVKNVDDEIRLFEFLKEQFKED